MGPITIFDKSFLQSLSLDEAVWFDHFFLTNITPLFFVETLADLEKAVRAGRTPEREVRIIADKTPEMNSYPNVYHRNLCISNLLGNDVPMDGRIIMAGGKPIKTADQSGIVYEVSPEAEAFSRWQRGEFLEIERQYAKIWRRQLSLLDFKDVIQALNSIGINHANCKTLEEAKSIAESIVNASGYSLERIKFFLYLLNLPERLVLSFINHWINNGCLSFKTFASFAAHVLTIEIFFYIIISANLISSKKVTNKIDIAYLFYLPLCMIFISSDNFHRRCAPLFLRDNQDFVWGPDLKADLKNIDEYYDRMPESEKQQGLNAIANRPPSNDNFLISRLWDHHMSDWRSQPKKSPPRKDETSERIVENIKKFTKSETLRTDQVDFDLSNPDAMVLKKRIRRKKGKWWQVPKNIENKNDL